MKKISKTILFMLAFIAFGMPLTLVASPVSMALILNEAENAADDLIEKGFDRLDQSIIQAGFELRAAVHAARAQYDRALDKTIDQLDKQQRKVVNDIGALTRDLENFENKQISEILKTQDLAVSAVYQVISGRPLIESIARTGEIPIYSNHKDNSQHQFQVIVTGLGLNGVQPESVTFGSTQNPGKAKPKSTGKDITFDLNLPKAPMAEELQNAVWRVPLEFTIDDCRFWQFFCKAKLFSYDVVVLPDELGTVVVNYVGQIPGVKKVAQTRGPFTSARVKSRLRLSGVKAGSRRDIWTASPSVEGNRIDLSSVKVRFKQLNSGCSNSRSSYSIIKQDPSGIQVRADTGSDRKAGATCKTQTTITFNELVDVTDTVVHKSNTSEPAKIHPRNGFDVPFVATNSINPSKFNFESVAITSPLFGDNGQNTRIFALGEEANLDPDNLVFKFIPNRESLRLIGKIK